MSQRIRLTVVSQIAALLTACVCANAAAADEVTRDTDGPVATVFTRVKASLGRQDEAGHDLQLDGSRIGNPAGGPPEAPAGTNPARFVFAMQADLSKRSSMVFEQSGPIPRDASSFVGAKPPAITKMGLEFRPVSPVSAKQFGSLRVQLAGNSSLLIRPRNGGLALAWRSQF